MANGRVDPHQSKLYSDLSVLYDLIFRRIFYPRIARVITSLRIPPGARVLELGVGTGLSLDAYPRHCHVVGIDRARDMLERAHDKIARNGFRHVTLMQMDALKLGFGDCHFDYVTAFHVVSVVPDPVAMVCEAQRVCRPGGGIVIINHFRGESVLPKRLTRLIDPVTRWLGWRATLSLTDVLNGAPLAIERKFKSPRRSLFTVVIARNEDELLRRSRLGNAGLGTRVDSRGSLSAPGA
jgi:phosphatidylethanolamine/phosphatidyl-N-methylethanolamine N-methyltransferase